MVKYAIGWSKDRIINIATTKRMAQDYAIQYLKKNMKADGEDVYSIHIYKEENDRYLGPSYVFIGTVSRTSRPVEYYYIDEKNITHLSPSRVNRKQ